MANKSGVLQTLTTGVSGLWSTTFRRCIRANLGLLGIDMEFSFCNVAVVSLSLKTKLFLLELRWLGAPLRSWSSCRTKNSSPNGCAGFGLWQSVPSGPLFLAGNWKHVPNLCVKVHKHNVDVFMLVLILVLSGVSRFLDNWPEANWLGTLCTQQQSAEPACMQSFSVSGASSSCEQLTTDDQCN